MLIRLACLEAIRSKILITGVCDKNKMLNRERAFILNTEEIFSNQGSLLAGKFRRVYCLYCTRATLISMEEDTLLVCRKTLY